MNLIACDGCGVVYDKDKLSFPEWIYNEEKGEFDNKKCEYMSNPLEERKCFVPFIYCRVCGERVYDYSNGE